MPRLSKPIAPTHPLVEARDAYLRSLSVDDKSPRTIESYGYALDKMIDALGPDRPLEAITPEDCEAVLLRAKDAGLSVASRAIIYRSMRAFLRWSVKRRLIDANPLESVPSPRVVVQPVEFVTDAEWEAILRTTATSSKYAFRARRDKALLLLLASTGARRNEIIGLTLDAVDFDTDTITVHGKGGKDRSLPLLPDAKAALLAYMRQERPRSPYASSEALWLSSKGPMSASGLAQMLDARARAAGVTRRVHPHELRHRFVAKTLRAGLPTTLVMAASGHTTPAMLNRYGAYTRQEDMMHALRGLAAQGVV